MSSSRSFSTIFDDDLKCVWMITNKLCVIGVINQVLMFSLWCFSFHTLERVVIRGGQTEFVLMHDSLQYVLESFRF